MTTTCHATSDPTQPVAHGRSGSRAQCVWLVLVGVLGGLLSGLFAIGGAILMVPLLMWRAGMDQRRAAATSLVAITPTAAVSSITYLIHGYVNLIAALIVALGSIVGAMIGSRLLRRLTLKSLQWIFIAFILVIAAYLLLAPTPERGHTLALTPVVLLGYLGLGVLTGISSGLFGIGGAIIAVPILISVFAINDLIAKGTALVVSIPTSVIGSIANRRSDAVDVRAGIIVGVTAALVSIPAVSLAVAIPARTSAILFAALLIAIAAMLARKAVQGSRTSST
ncbi:sulfite exporter TauE/SafE family protein [Mycolicibacterium sp. CBMA 226]|uniref:sulfite exporter TauE/SafE family protein n=1 Tax=Mycolicibacterium sp. CBMA 226 TaxID=2606611 RepID=UPI0014136BF7|nr:sulfite exporter TauE/SafE family protein [Mycolicibacterium sp. CBMA 226]